MCTGCRRQLCAEICNGDDIIISELITNWSRSKVRCSVYSDGDSWVRLPLRVPFPKFVICMKTYDSGFPSLWLSPWKIHSVASLGVTRGASHRTPWVLRPGVSDLWSCAFQYHSQRQQPGPALIYAWLDLCISGPGLSSPWVDMHRLDEIRESDGCDTGMRRIGPESCQRPVTVQ